VKIGLTFAYIIVCALILIPQIDYQNWYPDFLNTYDYNLSTTFRNHNTVIINKNESDLNTREINDLIDKIYKRSQAGDIASIYIEENEKNLEIHYPSNIDENIISQILSPGRVEFKKLPPLDEEENPDATDTEEIENSDQGDTDSENNSNQPDTANESNPDQPDTANEAASTENTDSPDSEPTPDPNNINPFDRFVYTGIKDYRIKDAQIVRVSTEGTVQIEFETDQEQIELIKEVTEEGATYAVFVDGSLNFANILPPNGVNILNPTLLLQMDEQRAKILISQILHEPLKTGTLSYEFEESGPIYNSDILMGILTAIIVAIALGLSIKALNKKESFKSIAGTALLIGGILTIFKFTTIIFSLPVLLLTLTIVAFLAIADYRYYPNFAVAGILIGFILSLGETPVMKNSFRTLVISGIYITGFYILLYFMRIYED
jgi:hypothetical protein